MAIIYEGLTTIICQTARYPSLLPPPPTFHNPLPLALSSITAVLSTHGHIMLLIGLFNRQHIKLNSSSDSEYSYDNCFTVCSVSDVANNGRLISSKSCDTPVDNS